MFCFQTVWYIELCLCPGSQFRSSNITYLYFQTEFVQVYFPCRWMKVLSLLPTGSAWIQNLRHFWGYCFQSEKKKTKKNSSEQTDKNKEKYCFKKIKLISYTYFSCEYNVHVKHYMYVSTLIIWTRINHTKLQIKFRCNVNKLYFRSNTIFFRMVFFLSFFSFFHVVLFSF